ncbi:hypothetical protein HYT92_01570 [Candidatus Pacearchaeota archaeon]|nr:hypothetical protein [Candidatus Pacearchaeota archaeon]
MISMIIALKDVLTGDMIIVNTKTGDYAVLSCPQCQAEICGKAVSQKGTIPAFKKVFSSIKHKPATQQIAEISKEQKEKTETEK